jgi:arylsulfatase A-like enzyme
VAIADDWGWPHAGAYGDAAIKTPHFDRVAREGALFKNAFVASPSCTPSRAALLTGQWHWRLEESANLWSTLQKKFPVYPDLLADAGYFVGHSGKGWGPGKIEPGGRPHNPAGPGFKNFDAFLDKRPAGKPFCFWWGSVDPHREYEPGSGAAAGIKLGALKLPACFPDDPEVRADLADYGFEVQRFDRDLGAILETLARLGELDRTIVVVTSDNGIPFPRCKGNLYDTGTHVPLAIRWPGVIKPGRAINDFVSLTDLAPTFLEAAGLRPTDAMTGRSLMKLLKDERSGRVDPARAHVLTGKERHTPCQEAPDAGGTPMRAIRTHDFLYIRNYRPDRWPAGTPESDKAHFPGAWYSDCDNGPTKILMVERRDQDPKRRRLYDLAFAKRPAEELYDLRKDPDQLVNVADDPAYAETKANLSLQLTGELKATGDSRVIGGAERFEAYPYYGGAPRKPK